MLNPSINLTDEQRRFLKELDYRTNSMVFNGEHRMITQMITHNGGTRDIMRNENKVPTLYLKRHYLYRSPNREAMIYQFYLGDKGPLHDHPADSWGCILETGYVERLCTSIIDGRTEGEYEVNRELGEWSFRPGSNPSHDNFESFHKVKLHSISHDAGNVFTFFVMEKRNDNSWGFRDNEGVFVPFDQMNKLEQVDKVQSSPDDYEYGWFPQRIAK